MALPQKQTAAPSETPPPVLPSKAELEAKLDKAEKDSVEYEGKKGYNPFVFRNRKLAALREALETAGVSNALVDQIYALNVEEACRAPRIGIEFVSITKEDNKK